MHHDITLTPRKLHASGWKYKHDLFRDQTSYRNYELESLPALQINFELVIAGSQCDGNRARNGRSECGYQDATSPGARVPQPRHQTQGQFNIAKILASFLIGQFEDHDN